CALRTEISTNRIRALHQPWRNPIVSGNSRLIQKYNNRRLYDTLEHRYITLQDVHQLVLNNVDFAVVDKRTQADITTSVLLDVLSAAHSSRREPVLDRDFLLGVIRKYCVSTREVDAATGDTKPDYLGVEPLLAH